MYLVHCNPKVKQISEAGDLPEKLAELIEYKLMGIENIKGKPWNEYATDVLDKYHQGKVNKDPEKPLWRYLYEDYCSMDKSYSPNIVFMQLIKTFQKALKNNFPNQDINRNILIDYLEIEIEKAMEIE